jgi:hypothetical protein
MELVKKAETALAGVFKGAPKMSDSAKESLVKAWPWLALIFGVLQLWAAWSLYELVRAYDRVDTVLGAYFNTYSAYTGSDKFFIYLSLAVLVIDAIILLVAYPKLARRQKRGWDLIFLGALLNLVYGVLNLFVAGRGFGTLLGTIIGSTIAFYLLLQVREKFNGAVSAKQL